MGMLFTVVVYVYFYSCSLFSFIFQLIGSSQSCNVSFKLEKIHSVILKKHDNDLYLRIIELAIPYEAYGM